MTSIERAKKGGKQAGPPLKVLQSEALHSINHIYQSAVLSAIWSSIQKSSHGNSIYKIVQLQSLARKSTLRLDISISQSLCQRCHVPLLPGLTSTIRNRTFASNSRVIQVQCRLCTLSRRQFATPSRRENGNGSAIRNRRKAARVLDLKIASQCIAVTDASRKLLPLAGDTKQLVPTQKKWSQRTRRRAGRVKAQMLKGDSKAETSNAIPVQLKESTSRSKELQLPRYASRVKVQSGWDSNLTSEMSSHEKEAIKMLRGDHLLTSGIGRGGFVGKIDTAL